jgi:hypothetical protein
MKIHHSLLSTAIMAFSFVSTPVFAQDIRRKFNSFIEFRASPRVFRLSLLYTVMQIMVFGITALVFLLNATLISILVWMMINICSYVVFNKASNKRHQQRIMLSPDIHEQPDSAGAKYTNYKP